MRIRSHVVVMSCVLLVLHLGLRVSVAQQLWAVRGTVVTPTEPIEAATVLIDGSRIRAIGHDRDVPKGARLIETDGYIYPGLIDLHNHVTWNVFTRWAGGQKYGARYNWQQQPEYLMALDTPHHMLIAEGHGCAAERFAEVKAVAGGATSQAGLSLADLSAPTPAKPLPNCLANIVRELGVASRLYPRDTPEPLQYKVFPLALDEAEAVSLREGLGNGAIRSALVHLAEGNPQNAGTRREFGELKARDLLIRGVTVIHGVALTTGNFAEMAKAGVGLVWSPRSNFELYGETSNVEAAKKAGVMMAIAPDWSPTGSDGMLQELKYAAVWNATQQPVVFTDQDLFEMATRNASRLAGIDEEVGTLEVGKRADLLVLKSHEGNAYTAVVHAKAADVELVVVDGVPAYGDADLMTKINGEHSDTRVAVCGVSKKLTLTSVDDWDSTVNELRSALDKWGSELSPITDCR